MKGKEGKIAIGRCVEERISRAYKMQQCSRVAPWAKQKMSGDSTIEISEQTPWTDLLIRFSTMV
jgi:hypothetical protein